MKVMLAYPNVIEAVSATPPLGIVLLGTILQKQGVDVDLVAANADIDWDWVKKRIELSKPDILGISILTPSAEAGFEMAKMAKEMLPNVFVVMGGPHATILPLETIGNEHVDAVCFGEGEETLIELVNNPNNLEGVKGIYYKKDGESKMNPPRPLIDDLDNIPFPNWSLLPTLEDYFKSAHKRELPMLLSRGCPFNCSFCQPTSRTMYGKKIRFRSIENVVDEIEYLIHSYNITGCEFQDDTFTFNKNWATGICEEIVKRGMRVSWHPLTRADLVTEEILVWMKKAGCNLIDIGVESGSEYIRNSVLGKGLTTESIKKAFQLCHKVGIETNAFMMLGSPGETKETLQQSLKLIREIKPHSIIVYRTTPRPGTFLWDKTIADGILNVEAYNRCNTHDFEESIIKLEDITIEDIRKTRDALQMEVYMMNLTKYLAFSFRHPLTALRRLTKPSVLTSLIGMAKTRFLPKSRGKIKSP